MRVMGAMEMSSTTMCSPLDWSLKIEDSIAHSSECDKLKHYKENLYSLTALFVTHFSCFFCTFELVRLFFYICKFEKEKMMR